MTDLYHHVAKILGLKKFRDSGKKRNNENCKQRNNETKKF